jgi:hypothetical protein
MNSEHRFDEDEQREWEAQENARTSTSDDALARRYRTVMRSLEALPLPSLRADLAGRVSRRAEAKSNECHALEPFERFAMTALAMAFAAAIVAAAAMANVLPSLGDIVREARDATGARWIVALSLCIAITCLPLSRVRERQGQRATTGSPET